MDLREEAQAFAHEIEDLLNRTVTNGVKLASIFDPLANEAFIGYGLSRHELTRFDGIPVGFVPNKKPAGYLGVFFNLRPDGEGRYPMVQSSVLSYGPDRDLKKPLMHYDFEREKNKYPAAHLQIDAESEAWERLRPETKRKRPLARLHFPVGGRRYRPSLEELIEFLVTEVDVEARDSWRDEVNKGRARFEERQLRAAVRRQPQWALNQLKESGHLVEQAPGVFRWASEAGLSES